MTTEAGRAFVMKRLTDATNLSELRRVWVSIAIRYQQEPEILALKDKLKAQMEAGK